MRVAVIGATGNVGTAILRRLAEARSERGDLEVVGIARRIPDTSLPPYNDVEWHSIDVGDAANVDKLTEALRGSDAVIHLAWLIQPNRDEAELHRVNVKGTENALAAAAAAGVRQFVCASSVGAYSPAPKDRLTDESWPARGIASSHYSRHKGEQEALLDRFELEYPEIAVARLRQGLVFSSDAGSEIGVYFVGRVIPKFILNKLRLPLIPLPSEFVFQAVHADDMADAYWRVVDQRAEGAFNIAADPVITPELLAGVLGAKRVLNVPVKLVRAVVGLTWAAHLQASDPGWIDLAAGVPVMDTARAREELGWQPRRTSLEALQFVLDGMSDGDGVAGSPLLAPRSQVRR
ncbi:MULTISPECIES: NAD-dependent epimerase/dehydratase family protein [unclassified Arthrobacter]|uniref:NAD-dependent epimerase/dehydratase family protein n=1 Tax=unclassified Arthrobacter TaxID=235627 RepID=UPI002101D5A6|nr:MULTISPECIES: NAD-dependent epimerase/dehydratase family protein [unclassified Arthrobacter]MCQ1985836.1 NAD-dependent epimerase/dehydratase family protein [Arthrobacter sp. zg-Y844]MCQ1994427.1 NAD-dependent epimerase/dehydratase family protein [Arthrobacter sp. zg-Y1171]UWX81483.1 NAD-dependent epimerase/dehydratase family protein [Arthrobacter sp. zg-Y1171]